MVDHPILWSRQFGRTYVELGWRAGLWLSRYETRGHPSEYVVTRIGPLFVNRRQK